MSHQKHRYIAAVTLALLTALAGCSRQSNESMRAEAAVFEQKLEYSAALITLKNALERDQRDPQTRNQMARVYLEIGDGLSAEKEARTALEYGQSPAAALPLLGRSLNLQGKFQNVLDETAAEAARAAPDLLTVRGDAHLGLHQHEEAKAAYNKALAIQPQFPGALVGLGRVAYVEGDVAAATGFAARALAAQPRNTDTLLFQGDLLRAEKKYDASLAAYQQVLNINPGHRSAHVERAYLLIALGKYELAQKEVDAAFVNTPSAVLVHYTQALLDYSQGKNDAALESMQKVLKVAPEHMPSLLLAGAISLNLGSVNLAEHHLRTYLAANPDNVYARKMLASALLRTGHAPDALQVLEPALKTSRDDAQLLALAGESFMQVRDFNKASELFTEATVLNPKAADLRTSLAMSKLGKGEQAQAISDLQLATKLDSQSQQAGLTLVRTELGLGHVDKAFEAVTALEQAQPDTPAVHDLKGLVLLARKDVPQARASFDKALALQPAYFSAAANLAQLDVGAGNLAGARQTIQAFMAKNKNSVEAMTAMASLARRDNKKEEATSWLEKASAVNPAAIGPAVTLIAHYLQIGANVKALDLASRLHVTHSGNIDLLDLLGKSQLANGDRVAALTTYKKLAVELPRSAHAQMQVAAMYMLANNLPSAEDHLKTALAIQPDFPAAQLAQAEVYVRKGLPDLALLTAERLQRKYPQGAAGFQLEADILIGQRKPEQALPAYEKAFALSKTNELAIKIAQALRDAGKPDDAARRIAAWLQQHPQDVRMQLYKAQTLVADKQLKAAAEQIEASLKLQPDNAVAWNNLALTYQQMKDARALQAAEQASKLAKDQPAVMDTLGWILVEQGDAARGVAILRQASTLAPKARDIRYHLAAGLAKTGDKAGARRELDILMSGNLQFAEADQARALLKQLP